MTEYIGNGVSKLLEREPFKHWPVKKSIDDTSKNDVRIYYVFEGHGLDVQCDRDDKVATMFLHAEKNGGFEESLFELPFSLNRAQVLERLGTPFTSGEKFVHPVLGKYGAWDRFHFPEFAIHVQYGYDGDKIQLITLMRDDVVPK